MVEVGFVGVVYIVRFAIYSCHSTRNLLHLVAEVGYTARQLAAGPTS